MKSFDRNQTMTQIPHILCRWHVSMNVLAKCKGYFPKAIKLNNQLQWNKLFQQFLNKWNSLISSSSADSFNEKLEAFQQPRCYPKPAVDYIMKTWLQPWKDKITAFQVDRHRHFGHSTTSIVESMHAAIKRFLWSSQGDLATAFQKLELFWKAQDTAIQAKRARRINKLYRS
ncbi:hypothetical protein V8C42DRAFT_207178 [Trichoderma barbatum]